MSDKNVVLQCKENRKKKTKNGEVVKEIGICESGYSFCLRLHLKETTLKTNNTFRKRGTTYDT
jgi:hypothetical protein